MMKRIAAALGLFLLGMPVYATGVLDPYFGNPGDCYYRAYDAAHLKAHPKQRVEQFAIRTDDFNRDQNYEITLFFQFKTRDDTSYTGVGLCRGNACGVEGDGGRFSLEPYRDGLLLKVDPDLGMSGESDTDYVDLNDSDDRQFLLYEARPNACD